MKGEAKKKKGKKKINWVVQNFKDSESFVEIQSKLDTAIHGHHLYYCWSKLTDQIKRWLRLESGKGGAIVLIKHHKICSSNLLIHCQRGKVWEDWWLMRQNLMHRGTNVVRWAQRLDSKSFLMYRILPIPTRCSSMDAVFFWFFDSMQCLKKTGTWKWSTHHCGNWKDVLSIPLRSKKREREVSGWVICSTKS